MYTHKIEEKVDISAYASVLVKFWDVGIRFLTRQGVTGPLAVEGLIFSSPYQGSVVT